MMNLKKITELAKTIALNYSKADERKGQKFCPFEDSKSSRLTVRRLDSVCFVTLDHLKLPSIEIMLDSITYKTIKVTLSNCTCDEDVSILVTALEDKAIEILDNK